MLIYQINYKSSKANLARLGACSFILSQNPIISTRLFCVRLRSFTYLFHCNVSRRDFTAKKIVHYPYRNPLDIALFALSLFLKRYVANFPC